MSNQKLKVCLVFPRFKYISGDPPLGLGYIASFIRKNMAVDISILDTTFNHSFDILFSQIRELQPDILGVYTDTIMYNNALQIINFAKSLKIFTIAGGPHATILPETLVDHADIVVIGEGENTFLEILKNYTDKKDYSSIKGIIFKKNGEIIKTPPREPEDLSVMQFPAWDLYDLKNYFKYWYYLDCVGLNKTGTTMIASRGCPFKCTYCQPTLNKLFGKKIRHYAPFQVASEIKMLKDKYKIDGIYFHDDTLTANKIWVSEFCDEIDKLKVNILWGCNSRIDSIDKNILKRMHASGLRNIHFGIESGSQRIIDEIYCKGIKLEKVRDVINLTRKTGIHTLGFFMMGAPSEKKYEILKTIKFAISLKLDEATFSIVTPLLGTTLYDMLKNKNNYLLSDNFSDYDYWRKGSLIRKDIFPGTLNFLHKLALFGFYLHPYRWKYTIKHFFTVRGIIKFYNKIRRFI